MLKKAGSGEGNLMDTKLRFWREKNNYKRKNKKDYLKKKKKKLFGGYIYKVVS